MAPDATETLIAKGMTVSAVLFGVGDLPDWDDPVDTLDSEYVEIGYHNEDGVSLANATDVLEVTADQALRPIRREAMTRGFTASWNPLQWNSTNLILALGGGRTYTTAAGVTVYDPPADEDPLDEVTLVFDWTDKGYNYRIVHERGNVGENAETSLSRRSAALLPVTYTGLEGSGAIVNQDGNTLAWRFVTDDPAFEPVS